MSTRCLFQPCLGSAECFSIHVIINALFMLYSYSTFYWCSQSDTDEHIRGDMRFSAISAPRTLLQPLNSLNHVHHTAGIRCWFSCLPINVTRRCFRIQPHAEGPPWVMLRYRVAMSSILPVPPCKLCARWLMENVCIVSTKKCWTN